MNTIDYKRADSLLGKLLLLFTDVKKLKRDIKDIDSLITTVWDRIQLLDLRENVHPLTRDEQASGLIYKASRLIKKLEKRTIIKRVWKYTSKIEHLKRRILSVRLGGQITAKMLEKHPEYERFIRKYHWDKAAVVYDHVLPVVNGEPGVIFDGKPMSFSTLKNPTNWSWKNWVFKQGMVRHWPYHFEKMVSHDQGDPAKWGNQYVVEIVTSLTDRGEDRPSGDHSWLRLKTPDGKIFSFGIQAPLTKFKDLFKNRLKIVLGGCADNPDRYETMDRHENFFHETEIAINEEKFETLKNEMERISKLGVPFGWLSSNCTTMIRKLLNKVGIQIKSTMTPSTYVSKRLFSRKWRRRYQMIMPRCIEMAFRKITNFFFRMLLRIAGNGTMTKKVKQVYGKEFKPDDSLIDHPIALRKWQRNIDTWRNEEIRKVQSEEKIQNIKFSLPMQFRVEGIAEGIADEGDDHKEDCKEDRRRP